MTKIKLSLSVGLILLLALFAPTLSHAGDKYNDNMFPPAPSAVSSINFDQHGFLIHGKRTFLVSAGMEYARVPRALWYDRLLRLKRAGFNCVEMYTFWNFHEPTEGKFNFTGDHDLNAFLKLIHKMGMYAIVRVGPYSCAEWDSGGFPIWLRFKPGVVVRVDNKPFEYYVDKWFDKLIPIVAANQINNGGSVILVQLENEHPLGWTHTPTEGYGTDIPNGYFQNLHDEAVKLGIQVPFWFSGMHHNGDPAEYNGGQPLDDPNRNGPWITTEFWVVWYSAYGVPVTDNSKYGSVAATFGRRTWRILANGGNGYNYYMAHGGSNFGYTNDDEDAASYDYGAEVGQGGDLRTTYYMSKKVGLFARSFQDILENSVNDPTAGINAATNPAVNVLTRTSPAGTIQFLDNPTGNTVTTEINAPSTTQLTNALSGALTLPPGQLLPVVSDFKLTPSVTLTWVPTRILGISHQGKTTTLVAYGQVGSPEELHFSSTLPVTASPDLQVTGSNIVLTSTFTADKPVVSTFKSGDETIRIISVDDNLADRTWLVTTSGVPYIICGPSYVGQTYISGSKLILSTEKSWSAENGLGTYPDNVWAFGPTQTFTYSGNDLSIPVHETTLTLAPWNARTANIAETPDNTRVWKTSVAPLPMGADGDLTADAWYKTTVNIAQSGTYIVDFTAAADRVTVYLDGKCVNQTDAPKNSIVFTADPGKHDLTLFIAHDGRQKFFAWLKPIDTAFAKGLLGPAQLSTLISPPAPVDGWKIMNLPAKPDDAVVPPTFDSSAWRDYKSGDSDFHNSPGYAWIGAKVTADNSGGKRTSLHLDYVDARGTVYLNGVKIGDTHEGWQPFDIPLADGLNNVEILVENSYSRGGISSATVTTRSGDSVILTNWRLSGGPGHPFLTDSTTALKPTDKFDGPTFYSTTFVTAPPSAFGPHPIWRVITSGLGHGSVWVNRHNLGRYPERVAINGLYIPECWLKMGINSLVIYDEDGNRPDNVTIQAETDASRDNVKVVCLKN